MAVSGMNLNGSLVFVNRLPAPYICDWISLSPLTAPGKFKVNSSSLITNKDVAQPPATLTTPEPHR